jgi:hypothetical protein
LHVAIFFLSTLDESWKHLWTEVNDCRQNFLNRLCSKNGLFWDATPCGSWKKRHFGGTSEVIRATPRNIPEDNILHIHRRKNLKYYIAFAVFNFAKDFLTIAGPPTLTSSQTLSICIKCPYLFISFEGISVRQRLRIAFIVR